MHLTHIIYSYIVTDSKSGNPLPPFYLLLFSDYQQYIFYMHRNTDRIAHTTAFLQQLWSTGRKK